MGKFLSEHLVDARLGAAAIMALPNPAPEPWVFIAMIRRPGQTVTPFKQPAVEGAPFSQMLSFIDGNEKRVFPKPLTNNLAADPVLPAPASGGMGVSTSTLFAPNAKLEKQIASNVAVSDIPDVIANPRKSHFFNTDCVSCHSETTRREILKIAPGPLAFKIGGEVPAIAPAVVPKSQWNVRNFGWFQRAAGQAITPTITQRTANETAEVVEHLNAGN
jgi:hypothetical protein